MSLLISTFRRRLPRTYRTLRRAAAALSALGPRHGLRYILLEARASSTPCRIWCRRLNSFIHLRPQTTDLTVLYETVCKDLYRVELTGPVETIVDAGANIGCTALAFANRYPEARIVAIEPERENFELLSRNTAGHKNVQVVQAALAGSTGAVELRDRGTGSWGFSICAGAQEGDAVEVVQAVSVGELMTELQCSRIDLLKLDIEGAEVDVFDSLDNASDAIGAIAVELHDRFRPGCTAAFRRVTAGAWHVEQRGNVAIGIRNAATSQHR